MLLDKGGAEMRQRLAQPVTGRHPLETRSRPAEGALADRLRVRIKTKETHDGADCGCVEGEMVLRIGDELVLTHVCHDGRVDKVVATVVMFEEDRHRPVEHGGVEHRPSGAP